MTFLLFVSFPALADCTSPSGAESQTQYDFTDHVLKYCDGTDWVSAGGGSGGGIPAGAVMAFDLTTCPGGWSEYTAARGRFLRGIDNGAGNDPDGTRAPGNTQADMFKSHRHPGAYSGSYQADANAITAPGAGLNYAYSNPSHPGVPAEGGAETRPKNVAVLFCRKN